MPGDLRDPEQFAPWHHDELYEHKPDPMKGAPVDVNSYIQDVAEETLGHLLNKDDLKRVTDHVIDSGYIHRNWGDPSFRKEVAKFLRKLMSARKVARRCQT